MKNNLTIVILTKNEEENIQQVINNAKNCTDYILVVDSGSEDKTVELAKAAGARVIYRAWNDDFSAQRNYALQNVDTDWILYLDADERLNDELIEAVKNVVVQNSDIQYTIKRKSVAFGRAFNYGVLKPDFVARLFKTKHVKWVNKVHEHPECADKTQILPGYIEHYTYKDWEHWLRKFDQYTTIWAQNAYENGKKVTLCTAILHAFFGFIQMGILKRGFMDGLMGIVMSINHFFYTLMKYLKLIELQRKGDNK